MTVVAQWDFTADKANNDQMDNFDPLIFEGGATLSSDGLNLGSAGRAFGKNYKGNPLVGNDPIVQKTLVSYLKLDSLGVKSGGSALTLQTGDTFDGIVFSERDLNTWECGSSNFDRTKTPNPFGNKATERETGVVLKMVAVYEGNSSSAKMTLYRNQELCGSYSQGRLPSYPAEYNTQVVFGSRFYYHPINEWRGTLDATILAAQIHDVALSPQQVAKLSIQDIIGTGPLNVGDKIQLQFSDAEPLEGYVTANGNGLKLDSVGQAATFQVVEALDPTVPKPSPAGMPLVSLQLNDGRYLVRGSKRTSGRLNGWYDMNLMAANEPGFDKKAAVLQQAHGFADPALLSLGTMGTGDNKWMKVDSGFLFSGPVGAPRYTPLATWKAQKI